MSLATSNESASFAHLPEETKPAVQLVNAFSQPFNNAIATARTCYSSRVIYPDEVAATEDRQKQRDAIAASTYLAGHHTTLQHAAFQFIIERVSRQSLWSFFHAHPFYNSEQVSQRYVEVKTENFHIPRLAPRARAIYLGIMSLQTKAYYDLIAALQAPVVSQYARIFPHRDPQLKKWASALKKRCLEIARYVLPVATHAHLYHTINGITLYRYNRLCQQLDVPQETRLVVEAMIEAVRKLDADFFKNLEDPLPLEETIEFQVLSALQKSPQTPRTDQRFIHEFDASLQGKTSRLMAYTPNAESLLAASVRSVLGLCENELSEEAALENLLNPAKNHYLAEPLNLNSLAKMTRSLFHAAFTFRKKLSHTADSQDQRHRLTPGARPALATHFVLNQPDYITPPLIQLSDQANAIYEATMENTWRGITDLLNEGVPLDTALYLLPNAFPIRFDESGDLAAFHHKWTTRLCYTAQEEIWNSCRDEVLQVTEVLPKIGKWLFPPCTLRKLAKVTPYCPEGERFCGVRVWMLDVEEFERLL